MKVKINVTIITEFIMLSETHHTAPITKKVSNFHHILYIYVFEEIYRERIYVND